MYEKGMVMGMMLLWMIVCGAALAAVFPIILHVRRRRARRELADRVRKARDGILADGVVSGPKGAYVAHRRWDLGLTGRTPTRGPPKARAYDGGPWPS